MSKFTYSILKVDFILNVCLIYLDKIAKKIYSASERISASLIYANAKLTPG